MIPSFIFLPPFSLNLSILLYIYIYIIVCVIISFSYYFLLWLTFIYRKKRLLHTQIYIYIYIYIYITNNNKTISVFCFISINEQLSFNLGLTVESSLRYSYIKRFSLIFEIPKFIFIYKFSIFGLFICFTFNFGSSQFNSLQVHQVFFLSCASYWSLGEYPVAYFGFSAVIQLPLQ